VYTSYSKALRKQDLVHFEKTMTQHDHQHHDHGHHDHHQGHKRKGLHRDWRTWVAVVLMLGAMAIYLLSMDESIQPAGTPGFGMPAGGPPMEAAP
jgi:hypothetical protein